MAKESNTYRRIKAVEIATRVLEYLSTKKNMATLTDVSTALELPAATVMCHLETLKDRGFVTEINGAYTLGMKVAMLWARIKANLEGKIREMESQVKTLEGPNG